MGLQPTSIGPSEFARSERQGDLTPFIKLLMRGHSLSFDQSRSAFAELMTGGSHHAEMGAFLALLAQRVPTVDELAGAATIMRDFATRMPTSVDPSRLLDTAGTGGAPKTFNVSTLGGLIAASAGIPVAKAGNRSRTGRGSAEILGALGARFDAPVEVQQRCLEESHFAFCFAPNHHPAARHAMPVRKALGFPTIFNLLGPLTNPARAKRHSIGVYDPAYVGVVARVLLELGSTHALVFHGMDGLDEVTTGASTLVVEVTGGPMGGKVEEYEVTPESLGLARANPLSIAPNTLDDAADLFRSVLANNAHPTVMAMALANAAAALVAGGLAETLKEGVAEARRLVESGAARATLDTFIRISNQ
jgi:anthranilate phosphoribosyltransferase